MNVEYHEVFSKSSDSGRPRVLTVPRVRMASVEVAQELIQLQS
jgi:hypothetical protein